MIQYVLNNNIFGKIGCSFIPTTYVKGSEQVKLETKHLNSTLRAFSHWRLASDLTAIRQYGGHAAIAGDLRQSAANSRRASRAVASLSNRFHIASVIRRCHKSPSYRGVVAACSWRARRAAASDSNRSQADSMIRL